jgi:hypothetical protein
LPQHFLYFLPLPQGQGSFLPVFGVSRLIGETSAWKRPRSSVTTFRVWFEDAQKLWRDLFPARRGA